MGGRPVQYIYGTTIWYDIEADRIFAIIDGNTKAFQVDEIWVDTSDGTIYRTYISRNGDIYLETESYEYIKLVDGVPQWPTAIPEVTKASAISGEK